MDTLANCKNTLHEKPIKEWLRTKDTVVFALSLQKRILKIWSQTNTRLVEVKVVMIVRVRVAVLQSLSSSFWVLSHLSCSAIFLELYFIFSVFSQFKFLNVCLHDCKLKY